MLVASMHYETLSFYLLSSWQIKFEALSDGGIGGKIGIRNIKAGLNSSCTCIPTEACPKITGEVALPLCMHVHVPSISKNIYLEYKFMPY